MRIVCDFIGWPCIWIKQRYRQGNRRRADHFGSLTYGSIGCGRGHSHTRTHMHTVTTRRARTDQRNGDCGVTYTVWLALIFPSTLATTITSALPRVRNCDRGMTTSRLARSHNHCPIKIYIYISSVYSEECVHSCLIKTCMAWLFVLVYEEGTPKHRVCAAGIRFLYQFGHQITMSKLVHMTEDNAVWTMCCVIYLTD